MTDALAASTVASPRTAVERKERNELGMALLRHMQDELPARFNELAKRWMSTFTEGILKEDMDRVFSGQHLDTPRSGTVFGQPLTQEGIAVCQQLVDFLRHHNGLLSVGIFRIPGCATRMARLRAMLSRGESIAMEDFTIADIASTLKEFLTSLPDPLLTAAHEPVYLNIAGVGNTEANIQTTSSGNEQSRIKRGNAVRLLIYLLPAENVQLLRMILELLRDVTANTAVNKMDGAALAVVFVPSLFGNLDENSAIRKNAVEVHERIMKLGSLVAMMIRNSHRMFDPPHEIVEDARLYYESSAMFDDISKRLASEAQGRKLWTPKRGNFHRNGSDEDLVALQVRPSVASAPTDAQWQAQQIADCIAQNQAMENCRDKERRLKGLNDLHRRQLGIKSDGTEMKKSGGVFQKMKDVLFVHKAACRRSRSVDLSACHGVNDVPVTHSLNMESEKHLPMMNSLPTTPKTRPIIADQKPMATILPAKYQKASILLSPAVAACSSPDDGVHEHDVELCRLHHCKLLVLDNEEQENRRDEAKVPAGWWTSFNAAKNTTPMKPWSDNRLNLEDPKPAEVTEHSLPFSPRGIRNGVKLPAFDEYRLETNDRSPLPHPLKETLI